MNEEEKDLYSNIFSLTRKISRRPKLARFASSMMNAAFGCGGAEDDSLVACWKLLKEYAGVELRQDEVWERIVDKADEVSRMKDPAARKMTACVLVELERRARDVGERD